MNLCMCVYIYIWASEMAQRLKHLPAMQETWVQSPGKEDPLEKEMATHSSILAWRIPWTEEPGGLQSYIFNFKKIFKSVLQFGLKGFFLHVALSNTATIMEEDVEANKCSVSSQKKYFHSWISRSLLF